ncbi:TPA: hypothetical protein EYP44_05790, partial [Candidatus Bathyarchaeota archaeon]|nr:hypothetical protein [Candidatus Bathyarchaeota archaeon]
HDHIDGEGLVSKGWLKTKILRAFKGEREVKRVPIKGIKSFHDDVYGAKRGENVIYVFAVGGITFCHLGDLGHVLTDDQVAEIGSVNVLFVPVGGVYTVDAAQATRVVEQLRPNIAIPMHYKIHGLMQALATVDDFIRGKENVRILEASDIAMRRQDLPPPTWILVFRPPVSGVRPPAA